MDKNGIPNKKIKKCLFFNYIIPEIFFNCFHFQVCFLVGKIRCFNFNRSNVAAVNKEYFTIPKIQVQRKDHKDTKKTFLRQFRDVSDKQKTF